MSKRKTINVKPEILEKLTEYKEANADNNFSESLNRLFQGYNLKQGFSIEPPAFNIGEKTISWDELKHSELNDNFIEGNNKVTVIYADDHGRLLRFNIDNDIFLEYFHFL
ncbi:hypothetical protein [Methanobrevibacter sp. DSM 116169]|uniref:hypothetical protein n=1 Tax=Methanobrevibacter sp. DSM 116169 TaxID=3242727 RepID=UPI0038FBE673